MRRINVRLRLDESCKDIDVLITTPIRDVQVDALVERIEDLLAGTLTVYDGNDSAVLLPEARIVSIATDNRRLKVVADNGIYQLRMSLRDVEELLNPTMFQRISRYEIINLRKVERFDFSVSGILRVVLQGGYETWVSRRFIPAIRERLQGRG